MGTTHADYFHGPIPCTAMLSADEIETDYEANIGRAIAKRFAELDPLAISAVLVAGHGLFAWGASPEDAVESAAIAEYLARLASKTVDIEPYPKPLPRELIDKHYLRKHGPDASYGQK